MPPTLEANYQGPGGERKFGYHSDGTSFLELKTEMKDLQGAINEFLTEEMASQKTASDSLPAADGSDEDD